MDQLIIREFCNHLYLGQWELMYGCFQSIQSLKTVEESVSQVLKTVAHTPSKATVDTSPWRLAWQCCTLQKALEGDNVIQETTTLSKEVELRLLFQDVFGEPVDNSIVLQEIYNCCIKMQSTVEPPNLSELSIKKLISFFINRPFQVHCLLKTFLEENVNDPTYSTVTSQIRDVYSCALQSSLHSFKAHLFQKSKKSPTETEKLKESLLTVLNLLPDSLLSHERTELVVHKCIHELLEFIRNRDLIDEEIYGTLLGRESPLFLLHLQKKEDELYRRIAEGDEEHSLDGYLSRVSWKGELSFREIFLHTIKRKVHFILPIMTSATEEILADRWKRTWNSLSPAWLLTLRPLAACLAWKNCSSDLEATYVIASIKALSLPAEPLQRSLVHLLQENVFVTEWILDQWRRNQDSTKESSAEFLGKQRNIFGSLQNQSPLSAVHRSIGFNNVFPEDTLKMLKQLQKSRVEILGKNSSQTVDQSILYLAYLTLSHVMDAIYNASELDLLYESTSNSLSNSQDDFEPNNSSPQPLTKLDEMRSLMEKQSFEAAYEKYVTLNLQKAKVYFYNISTVTYQAEILENIFSLLFVTHNDVLDTTITPSESDDGCIGEQLHTPFSSPIKHSEGIESFKFSLSKAVLKEESEFRTDLFASGGSSRSATSNSGGNVSRIGFLCTEPVLHDILDLLKVTIEDVSIASKGEYSDVNASFGKPISAVSKERLGECLSYLSKYVSEALWRFKVLSCDLELEPTSATPTLTRRMSSIVSYNAVTTKGNRETLQQEHASTKRRKKRRLRRCSILEDGSMHLTQQASSIIHRMLASPAALLCYSILQRKYPQAKEVLKMFSLKDTSNGHEAIFCQELQNLLSKLNAPPGVGSSRRESLTPGKKLSTLAMAASQGLQSTTCLQAVDEVLGKCILPSLPEIELLKKDLNDNSSREIKWLLKEAEDKQTIILADIAYTSCLRMDMAESLLSMAHTKTTFCLVPSSESKVKQHRDPNTPVGIVSIVNQMSSFFHECGSMLKSDHSEDDECPLYRLVNSPSQTLVQCLGSLNVDSLKRYVDSWRNFSYQKNLVTKMIREEDQAQVVLLSGDKNDAGILNAAFTRFAKLCSSEVCFFEDYNPVAYLEALNRRLKHVAFVLKKYAANKGLGWMSQRSHLAILKQSLDQLLGHLILKDIVSLDKLQELTKEIQMNLVHVIARTCYPTLPNARLVLDEAPVERKSSTPRSSIKPNQGPFAKNNKNPEFITRELLLQALQFIHDACLDGKSGNLLTLSTSIQICQHPPVLQWLEEVTLELMTFDLSLTTETAQKLALYGNLTNLCYLHAILKDIGTKPVGMQASSQEKFLQSSLLSPYFSERMNALTNTFYNIGQLGSVSLFHLLHWCSLSRGQIPLHLTSSPLSEALEEEPLRKLEEYFPSVDPKIVFVLNEGTISSPKLQVLTPDSVTSELQLAMEEYLNNFVEVDIDSEIVRIPELLRWHSGLFMMEDKESSSCFEGLLSFISQNVNEDLKSSIQRIKSKDVFLESCVPASGETESPVKNLPFKIEISPFLGQFGVLLKYLNIKGPQKPPKRQTNTSHLELPKHANEYIYKQCPLVANLLNILHSNLSESEGPLELQLNLHLTRWKYLDGGDSLDWLPTALSPIVYPRFQWQQLQNSLDAGDYALSLTVLEEAEIFGLPEDLKQMRERILGFLAKSSNFEDASLTPWSFALRIDGQLERGRAVLAGIEKWPTAVGLETLGACLGATVFTSELFPAMQENLVLLTLQSKILHVLNKNYRNGSEALTSWREAECLLNANPMQFLSWMEHEPQLLVQFAESPLLSSLLPTECLQKIWEQCVSWHLSQRPPVLDAATRALGYLPCKNLSIILSLLDVCPSTAGQAFLADFSLRELTLNQEEIKSICDLRLGIQMISLIPEPETYKDLIYHPLLLLEQLLMNLETETAEEILKATCKEPNYPVKEINSLLEQYALKAMEFTVVEIPSESAESVGYLESGYQFAMPPQAPIKENWTPDNASFVCMVCTLETFGMFCRRHHCRRCGRLVCAGCSQYTLIVNGYSNIPVRVCTDCFEQTTGHTSSQNSGSSSTINSLPSTISSPQGRRTPDLFQSRSSTVSSFKALATVLSSEPNKNKAIREEFCYEQAPSVTLCLSLLHLHSDFLACANCMLAQCDLLFDQLLPRNGAQTNIHVDYALLISMMRLLVLSARVKFLEGGRGEEEAVHCDAYLRSLDLVHMLVKNNCVHLIPSAKASQLNSLEAVRSLLKQLLEEERMTLALEMATKCSLDPSFLWATWGMVCLKAGHWALARDKFSRCLQKPQELSQSQQENPLIKEIVSVIENSRAIKNAKDGGVFQALKSLKSIQGGITELRSEEVENVELLNECRFYLIQYGSPASMIAFLLRHNLVSQAVAFVIEKGFDSDLLLHSLLLPSGRLGQLDAVLHHMRSQEPTLGRWWLPLMATCQHLQKSRMYHLLHTLQVFMGDFIRAAMTCIHFFQCPCPDYITLADRLNHLKGARRSFDQFLKLCEEQSSDQKRRILQMPPKAVQGHIETVLLQTEVTMYLSSCCETRKNLPHLSEVEKLLKQKNSQSDDPEEEEVQNRLHCPPTLFDNNHRKKALACYVLFCSLEDPQGVELGIRILKSQALDITQVCSCVGELLIRQGRSEEVQLLLGSLSDGPLSKSLNTDQVVLASIQRMAENFTQCRDTDVAPLLKLLVSEANKISAYILCKKLRTAYLLAIRLKRVPDVLRILTAARQLGQDSVASFCEKWLRDKAPALAQMEDHKP